MLVPLKRKIFYIPGFDPRSEAYYKKLLLKQFPEIKNGIVSQSRQGFVSKAENIQVNYEILSWHDEVQSYWGKGYFVNFKNVFVLFKEYVFKGAYFRLYKTLSKRDAIQKAFSVYFFLIWFLFFLAGTAYLASDLFKDGIALSFVVLTPIFLMLNYVLYRLLDKLNVFWVTRIMNFFVLYANNKVPKVIAKEQVFKNNIRACIASNEFDEVVLVAHSVGTILCLNILVDFIEDEEDKPLKVVTLGHCVSAVSMIKNSEWFNNRLQKLADRKSFWVDVTAGKDAVAFYKVNPALIDKAKPNLTLSAGFHKVFDKAYYQSVKWNFYKVHFLYLYNPNFPAKSVFNYQKLLTEVLLFQELKKG